MKFNALKYTAHLSGSSQKVRLKCTFYLCKSLLSSEWEKMRVFLSLSGFPIPPNTFIYICSSLPLFFLRSLQFGWLIEFQWDSVHCIPLIPYWFKLQIPHTTLYFNHRTICHVHPLFTHFNFVCTFQVVEMIAILCVPPTFRQLYAHFWALKIFKFLFFPSWKPHAIRISV